MANNAVVLYSLSVLVYQEYLMLNDCSSYCLSFLVLI